MQPTGILEPWTSPTAGVQSSTTGRTVQLSIRRVIAMAPGCAQFQTARSLAQHDLHFVELSVVLGLSRIVAKNVPAPDLSAQFVNRLGEVIQVVNSYHGPARLRRRFLEKVGVIEEPDREELNVRLS